MFYAALFFTFISQSCCKRTVSASGCFPRPEPSGRRPAGGPFGAYASLVIGRRLADYYRASHRFDAEVSLAPQTFDGTVEADAADAGVQLAVVEKLGEMRTVCAAEEIKSADEQFAKYGFSFYDLASCSPKSDKTRRGCGMAAAALSRSGVLAASLRRS